MLALQNRSEIIIPKLHDYWPGQGGIFRGTHLLGGFLIEATGLLSGRFEYGNYGKDLQGYSDLDGAENTRKLIEIDSPSAKAAGEFTSDGHTDFFLPSQRELMQCYLASGRRNIKPWVQTSTPFDSSYAWAFDFEYGRVYRWHRHVELAVLPVRRFIPSSL